LRKHKNMLLISTFCLSALPLAGCQTAGVKPGIAPLQGLIALEVVADSCTPSSRTEQASQQHNLWQSRTTIEDLTVNNEGWVSVNFTNSDPNENLVKGQATYNPKTLESACSASHEDAKHSNALVIYRALVSNTSSIDMNELRAKIKDFIRPVNVEWPGGKQLIAGKAIGVGKNDIYQRSNEYGYHKLKTKNYLERGWLTVPSPDGSGACSGIYQLTERYPSEGTWALYCPNKMSATGTFKLSSKVSYKDHPSTYYYENAEGIGTDSQGQSIHFTMPWRDGTNKYAPF